MTVARGQGEHRETTSCAAIPAYTAFPCTAGSQSNPGICNVTHALGGTARTDMDMLLDMLPNGASFLVANPDADPGADALGAVAAAAALLLAALAWRYSGNASTSPETPSSFDSSLCWC